MGLLGTIVNFASSGIFGGLSGILGHTVSSYFNLKAKKIEYQHQLDMVDKQKELLQVQVKISSDEAEQKSLQESYKDSRKDLFDSSYFKLIPSFFRAIIATLFALADFLRKIIRPILTVYLAILISWLAYKTYLINPKAFASSPQLIINMILYSGVSIFTWWFADRKMDKYFENEMNNPRSSRNIKIVPINDKK